MTNDYYKLLLSEKWVWKKNDESSEGKMVKWVGPAQYEDANTKTLMMLPTDYSLVQVQTISLSLSLDPVTDGLGQSHEEMGRNLCQRQRQILRGLLQSRCETLRIGRSLQRYPYPASFQWLIVLDDVKPMTLKKTENAAA